MLISFLSEGKIIDSSVSEQLNLLNQNISSDDLKPRNLMQQIEMEWMDGYNHIEVDNMHAYGCWCYFDGTQGQGTPVDEYDEICKVLQDEYSEAVNANGPSCKPWEVKFKSFEIWEHFHSSAPIEEACTYFLTYYTILSDGTAVHVSLVDEPVPTVVNYEPCAISACVAEKQSGFLKHKSVNESFIKQNF